MNLKAIVIYEKNEAVEVCELKTFVDEKSFEAFCKTAKTNREKQRLEQEKKEKEYKQFIDARLKELELNLTLRGWEIDMLRGKITEEEYEERKQELWNSGTN